MFLSDYYLELEGHQLPLSAPEQGTACEHHGGHYSFGVPAIDADLAEEMAGRTARLLTVEGKPVAMFHVEHFDRELFLLSGDVQPFIRGNAHQGHGLWNALSRFVRRTGIWEPGT